MHSILDLKKGKENRFQKLHVKGIMNSNMTSGCWCWPRHQEHFLVEHLVSASQLHVAELRPSDVDLREIGSPTPGIPCHHLAPWSKLTSERLCRLTQPKNNQFAQVKPQITERNNDNIQFKVRLWEMLFTAPSTTLKILNEKWSCYYSTRLL